MSNNILEIQRDTDKMTGLWNRGFCEREITSYLLNPESRGALLVIDVDDFKMVNDCKGHDCGDLVLKKISAALKHSFRSTDIIGRMGGDEFLIYLPNAVDYEIIRHRITSFLEDLSNLNIFSDGELYLSKQNGKNQYAFYHVR